MPREVGHDLVLELAADALPVQEVEDPAQAERPIEEDATALLEVEEDLLHVGEPEAEVAREVLAMEGELPVDVFQGGEVLLEQGEAAADDPLRLAEHVEAHAQRVQELQAHAHGLVERARHEVLEGEEAARAQQGLVGLRLGTLRLSRGDREHLGAEAEEREHLLLDEAHDRVHVLGRLEDVDLVERHHHLLAPGADDLQERALALREGAIGGGHEEHEVRAGDELAGELLVAPDDGVRPRGVHDVDLVQEIEGHRDHLVPGPRGSPAPRAAVPQETDAGGRGRHPLLEDPLAEERVDDRALAGVELTHHHQQEQLVELGDRAREGLLLVRGGVEAHEHHPQLAQLPPLLPQQLLVRRAEDPPEHGGHCIRRRAVARTSSPGPSARIPPWRSSPPSS
ncbi:MAG: hypothetical protein A2V74_00395 [Acidobacteria bacterium RBG_16_70_10]|nr:MAG: hypothetical protein A2V74_00395 [Acidobacteria bacterium RBG_16_70_10]